jgi:hypothetical protein
VRTLTAIAMLLAMASPPRTREEERRLNVRTLAIASAASASAAAVTSQLWIAGTWIAAAVTPLIVAIVSELLHRPTERLARAVTTDSPALQLDESEEPAAPAARPDPDAPQAGPVRVYRQPVTSSRSRRRVVALTALLGLLIGGAALTAAELIAGESIGKSSGRTSLGVGKSRGNDRSSETPEEATPTPDSSGTTPETTPTTPEEQPTVTVTVPAETVPPTTTTTPTQTTP